MPNGSFGFKGLETTISGPRFDGVWNCCSCEDCKLVFPLISFSISAEFDLLTIIKNNRY